MNIDKKLDHIEAIVADIERLDAETKGQFRQVEDWETLGPILNRLLKKIRRNMKRK
jgi:hypothetical protein